MNPKLSVVVPVYNVEKFLDECITHIINQTYRNLEIILVNDGSTDNSKKIIDKYCEIDNRILCINKKNGGLSSARNAGINIATGDYITFVDSDDYPDIRMYEILMALMRKYSTYIAVCSYFRNEDRENNKDKIYDIKMSTAEAFYEISINRKLEAHAWSKIYRTELFKEVRYPEGRLYEDIFTTYKLIQMCDFVAYTNEKLYFYRVNNESITNRKYKERDIDLIYGSIDFLNFLEENHYRKAALKQKDTLTRNAIALIRKMLANECHRDQMEYLVNIIVQGYPKYFKSQYKLSNKIFGIGVIIYFKVLCRTFDYRS